MCVIRTDWCRRMQRVLKFSIYSVTCSCFFFILLSKKYESFLLSFVMATFHTYTQPAQNHLFLQTWPVCTGGQKNAVTCEARSEMMANTKISWKRERTVNRKPVFKQLIGYFTVVKNVSWDESESVLLHCRKWTMDVLCSQSWKPCCLSALQPIFPSLQLWYCNESDL